MLFEGDPQVLQNLRIKRDLLARGDARHELFRIGLGVGGGALCGTYGAGQLASLGEHGHLNTFDFGVTASTGTPATSFFVSGQVEEARSVYWKECTTPKFLSLRRLIGGFVMDIDYLCNVFRGENDRGLKLDVEALRRSRTAFYAAATTQHGKAVLLDMRTIEDPIEAIKASIAIPGISRGHVKIGEEVYFDGAGTVPFPPTQLLERFAPTDILLLANCPRPTNNPHEYRTIPSAYLQSLTKEARVAFETQHERFDRELAALRAQKECRYAIIWTDTEVGPFERNPKKLEAASHRAKEHLNGLLAQSVVSLSA